jgi:PEP-CTERM motif
MSHRIVPGSSYLRVATLLTALFVTPFASAATITYTSLASFEAAVGPTIVIEDFQEANVAASTFRVMTGPLSSTTNNAIFQPGDITSGLSISGFPPSANILVVLGDGFVTGATKAVGSAIGGAATDLTFDPGVYAVGFDVFLFPVSDINLTVIGFDDANIPIFGFRGLVSGIDFFGVSSDLEIARLQLFAFGPAPTFVQTVEFVDNIRAPVPEPTSLALLGLGLAGMAGRRWRQRKAS